MCQLSVKVAGTIRKWQEKFTLTWASPRKRYLHYNRDPTGFTDTLSFPMAYWRFQFSTNVEINVCNIMLIPGTHWSSRWSPLIGIGWSKGVTLLGPISFIFMQFSAKTLPNNRFSLQNQGLPPTRLGNTGSATDRLPRLGTTSTLLRFTAGLLWFQTKGEYLDVVNTSTLNVFFM